MSIISENKVAAGVSGVVLVVLIGGTIYVWKYKSKGNSDEEKEDDDFE